MDLHDLPEVDAAERYTSLFIQDDEPLENLRPKKTNPFEECSSSSSSSDSETDPPSPSLPTRTTKPDLIIIRPVYESQYRPPPTPRTARPTTNTSKARAQDIKRAGEVLNAARNRQVPSHRHRVGARTSLPPTTASAPSSVGGEYTSDTARLHGVSTALSPSREVVASSCSRPQMSRRFEEARDGAKASPRRPRSVFVEEVLDAEERVRDAAEMREAGKTLLSLFHGGGDDGGD